MPYVTKKQRRKLAQGAAMNAGELNYKITMLIKKYIEVNQLSYQVINDILGALEGSKLEFYRRIAIPHENNKITENGDVY